jgi:hypothetical protein
MKQLSVLAVACVAAASFLVLVSAHAEPAAQGQRAARQTAQGGVTARSAGAVNGAHVDAAGQRRLLSDGQGNVGASSSYALTTASGSNASGSTRFTRSANGTAAAKRSRTATNARTGVTYQGSTTYTQGSGISRSGGCTDAAGNSVTCGAARP